MRLQITDIAPEGTLWWCPECGRISGDRFGQLATRQGWTPDCSQLAMLVVSETMVMEPDGRVREADVAPADAGQKALEYEALRRAHSHD